MTVEAAIALPLFVFFGLALLAPMQWLDTQRKTQTKMERLAEELSQYAYLKKTSEGQETENESGNESDEIQFELEYREELPFFRKELPGVRMKVAVKRRGWVGLNGKLTEIREGEASEWAGTGMVYVTPNGQRYHRYRDCQYLSNVCRAVSVKELETLRNNDGSIFYACEQCVGRQGILNLQDIVYITDWGTRYHRDRSCASVSLCFRKVPLAEVKDLGECSVCAGREEEELGDGDSEN